jgi:hypothetical protein
VLPTDARAKVRVLLVATARHVEAVGVCVMSCDAQTTELTEDGELRSMWSIVLWSVECKTQRSVEDGTTEEWGVRYLMSKPNRAVHLQPSHRHAWSFRFTTPKVRRAASNDEPFCRSRVMMARLYMAGARAISQGLRRLGSQEPVLGCPSSASIGIFTGY